MRGFISATAYTRTTNTFSDLLTTPPRILSGFLDGERGDWMHGKRGDSGDVTQQWQEVTSDQHRLARSRSSGPTNIPAEEINMEHKQSQDATEPCFKLGDGGVGGGVTQQN